MLILAKTLKTRKGFFYLLCRKSHSGKHPGHYNAFSENHRHMVAIHHMYYNFWRVHQTLRVTPQWRLASRITFGQ